jgi:hypothetical protein
VLDAALGALGSVCRPKIPDTIFLLACCSTGAGDGFAVGSSVLGELSLEVRPTVESTDFLNTVESTDFLKPGTNKKSDAPKMSVSTKL